MATRTDISEGEGGPPDFVGVGVQRAGTKWWFKLITDHPQVEAPGGKELHFFDRYSVTEFDDEDVRAYHRLFPRTPKGITGEWTPRYMHDFWTPALLHRAAPETKILVLLRDPWSRYLSGLGHEARALSQELRRRERQRKKDPQYVRTLVANDSLSRSLYARQISELLAHFDRAQVLALQYEHCVLAPDRELRRTYEFLGLDEVDHQPTFLTQSVGRSSPPREVPGHLERGAREMLVEDAAKLGELLPELDLSAWPSCRGV